MLEVLFGGEGRPAWHSDGAVGLGRVCSDFSILVGRYIHLYEGNLAQELADVLSIVE